MSSNEPIMMAEGLPLIKFQSAERIRSLQKGLLYAKTLDYYRKLEESTGDKHIGDLYEGIIPISEGTAFFPDNGETMDLKGAMFKTTCSFNPAFCMFGISLEDEQFSFSEEQKNELLSFGDTALIIKNRSEFKRRVFEASIRKDFVPHFEKVRYYDPSVTNADMLLSLMGDNMWRVAYWKRDIYAYQQEERFFFVGKEIQDHVEIDIGDISDISEILPVETVLKIMVKRDRNN